MVVEAFGPQEGSVVARVVREIRASPQGRPGLELVAVGEDDGVLGHVGLSGTRLVRDDGGEREVLVLTPLAVKPTMQRRGIGSSLVRRALDLAAAAGEPLVVLEGDPLFYGRFGFVPSAAHGIHMDLPDWAPPEAAQVALLPAHDASDPTLRGRIVHPPHIPAG